jgi:hypothetical protein
MRLLAFVGVALALLGGLFGFGRLTDDAGLSMGLTVAWFGLVFAAAVALALWRRALLWPLAAGYVGVAVAAGIFVVAPTLIDKRVDERVVTGTPVSRSPRTRNVELAAGSFRSLAHSGTGTAAVVRLRNGQRKLTLTEFETSSGPDLRVYLSTGDPAGGDDLGEFEDLGGLKGNIGNQQYTLPAGLDLGRYSTVVVWCRAFSVAFTSAALERA